MVKPTRTFRPALKGRNRYLPAPAAAPTLRP